MSEKSVVLDCLGALCPTPIIQLSKSMKDLDKGSTILLKADDPATRNDLQAWSRMTGNAVRVINDSEFEITKN